MKKRLIAALIALVFAATAFSVVGCSGESYSVKRDKADFARKEIETIAREYTPLADEAFADESAAMQAQRAALRARLFTIIEFILQDIKVTDDSPITEVLARAALLIMGGVQ